MSSNKWVAIEKEKWMGETGKTTKKYSQQKSQAWKIWSFSRKNRRFSFLEGFTRVNPKELYFTRSEIERRGSGKTCSPFPKSTVHGAQMQYGLHTSSRMGGGFGSQFDPYDVQYRSFLFPSLTLKMLLLSYPFSIPFYFLPNSRVWVENDRSNRESGIFSLFFLPLDKNESVCSSRLPVWYVSQYSVCHCFRWKKSDGVFHSDVDGNSSYFSRQQKAFTNSIQA